MKKNKIISVIVMILLMSLLIVMLAQEVRATGTSDNPISLDLTYNDNKTEESKANQELANQVLANELAANAEAANREQVIQPSTGTENSSSNNTNETLPQTGVTEDITIMFFIVVCIICAIYAYKKIRDYNI